MSNDLHEHIIDHLNDCARGILDAVGDELLTRAKGIRADHGGTPSNAEQALREAAQDIHDLRFEFRSSP